MNLGFLTKDIKISRRKFAAVLLLNTGTLAWFFLFTLNMPDIFAAIDPNTGQMLFIGSAIFWSIATSFIGGRISRRKLLVASILLGTLSTILLGVLDNPLSTMVMSLMAGFSLGLGLPSSMALVADETSITDRGRVAGLVIFSTFVAAFSTMAVAAILSLDPFGTVLLFAVVRSTSFFALIIDKCEKPLPKMEPQNHLPFAPYRNFFFYIIPWVIFTIASSLAWNLIDREAYPNEFLIGNLLRYVFIATFGLLAGIMADRFGRKQPIIIGLIVLGIGFALLGFNLSPASVIIYLALSGITWGSFFVVFLAVPGDLSVPSLREKFYALAYILPLAGMFAISAVPGSTITDFLPASLIAQMLSILLFLSIVPVLRAKETLHESKIQERKMKEYAERVGKTIQEANGGK